MAPPESLPALAWKGRGGGAEDLLVDPPEERAIELHQLLTRDVRKHGTALALVHEIPHRGDGRLPPALVGHLRIVGYEVKFTAAVVETTLLDFMAAHG
jgi:hypothetical protein